MTSQYIYQVPSLRIIVLQLLVFTPAPKTEPGLGSASEAGGGLGRGGEAGRGLGRGGRTERSISVAWSDSFNARDKPW